MNERSCQVEGCERSYYAKGFCQHHYHKNRNQGAAALRPHKKKRTELASPLPQKPCSAWKCDAPVYRLGVCRKHYEEWHMEELVK